MTNNKQFKNYSDTRLEARLCGVGGQGIVLGSGILADAAIFHEGKYAVQSPTFGSQVRGGPTKVDVIIDTQDILYPKATNINFFFAIAQSSFNKYFYDIAEGCEILLDENVVRSIPEEILNNTSYNIIRLPVIEMAQTKFKNTMLSNMISLGIIQEATQVIKLESLLKAVEKNVPPKHLQANFDAVHMGVEIAKQREANLASAV